MNTPTYIRSLLIQASTLFFSFLFSSLVVAQPSGGMGKNVTIQQLSEKPVIDGSLDEKVWSQATLIEDLHQVFPTE
jgi:hypothetical protein